MARHQPIKLTEQSTSFHSRGVFNFCTLATNMDFTQFLQDPDAALRLPYFEGLSVCDADATHRLREPLESGWYEFRKSGRWLTVVGAIEPEPDKWQLKRLTGYTVNGQIVTNDLQARLFGLPADEDLPRFAPVGALRWFDGHLLYDRQEFETEAEPEVRNAFEEERPIAEIKGVTPALAQVFVIESMAREMVREAERRVREAAEQKERAAELARWQSTIEGRISLALSHTGAELMDWRRQGAHRAVVRYRLGARRFECVIDTGTLQIVDAGICLEGADQQLNLASLPSAVREAIDTGQLHVFRRV